MFLEQFYSDVKQTRAKKHPLKDDGLYCRENRIY